jgi:hypothetical protein
MSAPVGLTIKNNINDMNIGDCISFRYTATTSGVAGAFSELGTCTAAEIPITGSATPNGLAYFIKVAKGLYICDRVIQHSIAWDTLNKAKYINGSKGFQKYLNSSIFNITSNYGDFSPVFSVSNKTVCTSPTYKTDIVVTFTNLTFVDSLTVQGYSSNATYKSFNFYGSNDNNDFSFIYKGVSPSAPYPGLDKFNFSISKKYKYYKISFLDGYGALFYLTCIDMYNSSECLIRSLSGGNSYLGIDSKSSLTNQSLGGYPNINEWDKYIVKSDLDGKITAGDDNIWHWNGITTWNIDTTINSFYRTNNDTVRCGVNSDRICRSYNKDIFDLKTPWLIHLII